MNVIRTGFLVGALTLLCGYAFGQSVTGTLQGIVQDPTGAVVPGAKIQIKDTSAGITRNAVSGSDGLFILNGVDPATYNLTVTKDGFKVYEAQSIALTPNERRDLGKISLTVGSVSEEVSVVATTTPVQTSSSENSKLIEASQLANITIKGRDLFEILETIPGVSFGNALLSGTTADATSNASGTFGALQINGGGTARTNFVVDGVPDVDNGNNAQVDFEPTMDTISEIRVLTSNYQAEFGHSSSGQISLITKGGASSFHGSAFYNKRHEMFNAKDFFTNLNGNQKTISRYGVYGYTIGGPVYIPKVWNTKKNKLFFFWSQEYTKQKPSSTQQAAMVPTAAQLQGNFFDRCLVNTGVNGIPCVPGYTDNNGNDKSTFLVNPTAGKVPLANGNLTQLIGSSVYNPASAAIGQAMLKYLPLPNLCTAAAGIYNGMAISPTNCPAGFSNHPITNPSWNYGDNYFWTATEVHPRRNDTVRFDYNLNDRNRIFVRYSQDYDSDLGNFGIPVKDSSGNYAPTASIFTKPGHGYAAGITTTLTSTMVNEFTFGKIFNGIGFYEADDAQVQRGNMGNPPSFDNFATDPLFNDSGKRWLDGTGPLSFADYVPTVAYGDAAGRNENAPSTNPCWNGCPYTNKADSWTFADNLSKVVGKHNLKAGVYVERTSKIQDGSQGNYLGSYSFNNDSNNPLDTGDGYANAWLGNFRQYSEGQKNIGDWKFWQVEFYVQDSWRVTPRLTLDLGLRFYAMPPITNVATGRNASTEFVASAYNQNQVERLYVGECVNATTNALISTANGPCPSTATTRAYDPVTGNIAISSLIGTFVPNSVANYPSTATPYPGMVIAGSSPALPQGLYNVPFISPSGRFGFAWDVFGNGKTAFRGGIGQYLNRLSYNQIASPSSFPPVLQSLNLYYGNISSITSGAASNGALSPGSMNADFTGNQENESTYNGSLQIQQKVPFSTVVEASWVYELRRHVPLNIPLDYFPLYSQFNNGAAWVNPQQAYLQNNALTGYQGGNSGLGLLGNQYIFGPSVCPTCVSGYSGISAQQFEGTSNYNALQINVRRNMTRHLSFGYAFTWDKSMGPNGASLNNGDPAFARDPLLPDTYRNWGPSYSPTPFYFTVNSVYEVPGLGEKLHAKALGWVTDRWVLSGLYQWRSNQMTGIPTPGFANTNSNCSSAATCYPMWNWTGTPNEGYRANVSGNYNISSIGGTLLINPAASTTATNVTQGGFTTPSYPMNGNPGNQIINTAAFTIPFPCSQFAQSNPRYGVGENLSCLGNAGAGSLLNIPGTRVSNLDMTVTKNFPLHKEGRNLQFRAEMYNLPNHTQFSGYNITPTYDWRSWLQGRLVQTNANLNRMTSTLNPRQMEMSLRLVF